MKKYERLAIYGGKKTITKIFKKHQSIGLDEIRATVKTLRSGVLSGFVAGKTKSFYGGRNVQNFENKISELFSKIPKIANAIIKATNADGFSIAQNNGKAAKQIIPHVHVHIIPRYNTTGTEWTKRKILNEDELDELAKKIRVHLK